MRELKQDWRDLFGGFKVAFDIWKLVLAFLGLGLTILCLWGMSVVRDEVTAIILGALVLVGMFIKFATSETGLSSRKFLGLVGIAVILAGLVLLGCYVFPDHIKAVAILLVLLVIWALFGGAISRIAVVEISTDDRLSIGESLCYARRRYTTYFGATVLPLIAVGVILLGCYVYGLLFALPVGNIIMSILFFVVVIAAFMMTLITLGGIAGAPLMYPAVSAEGNDAFDAISRSYSYVFGRPWRYLFYNLTAFVYGVVCVFFVAMFVLAMLCMSTSAIKAGSDRPDASVAPTAESTMSDAPDQSPSDDQSNKIWSRQIAPRVAQNTSVILDGAMSFGFAVSECIGMIDPTGWVQNLTDGVMVHLQNAVSGLSAEPAVLPGDITVSISAVLITIVCFGLLGLVLSYIISLAFSLQATIYLLLRKAVDGADMTEVFLEEEMDEPSMPPAVTTEPPKEVKA